MKPARMLACVCGPKGLVPFLPLLGQGHSLYLTRQAKRGPAVFGTGGLRIQLYMARLRWCGTCRARGGERMCRMVFEMIENLIV